MQQRFALYNPFGVVELGSLSAEPGQVTKDVCNDFFAEKMARPTRFERATPAFGGQYSIQLSYGRLN